MVAVAQHAHAEVERLEVLDASVDWGKDEGSFFGRAALEYGLRLYAMEADWARWLVKAIEKQSEKKVSENEARSLLPVKAAQRGGDHT